MNNQIVIYQTDDGQTQVDVRMKNETVWLSANQMAMLFGRDEKTVRKHVNNVFKEGELEKERINWLLSEESFKKDDIESLSQSQFSQLYSLIMKNEF